MAHTLMYPWEFYDGLTSHGWKGGPARLCTIVAYAATECDLAFNDAYNNGPLALPNEYFNVAGQPEYSHYSMEEAAKQAALATRNGTDWTWCYVAYNDTTTPLGHHPKHSFDKGSPADVSTRYVDKSLEGDYAADPGAHGIGTAGNGWYAVQQFVGSWGQNAYSQINSAAAAIRKATR